MSWSDGNVGSGLGGWIEPEVEKDVSTSGQNMWTIDTSLWTRRKTTRENRRQASELLSRIRGSVRIAHRSRNSYWEDWWRKLKSMFSGSSCNLGFGMTFLFKNYGNRSRKFVSLPIYTFGTSWNFPIYQFLMGIAPVRRDFLIPTRHLSRDSEASCLEYIQVSFWTMRIVSL